MPSFSRWIRSSGVRSISSMSSARSITESGTVSRTRMRVILRDHVVQAFDVLDVQRGVDVDAGGQQFLDIQIALGMAAAGRVGVRQFIHQHQSRAAGQDRVQVHLASASARGRRCVRRGIVSSPAVSASVSARPCVSTTPIDDIDASRAAAPARRTASHRSCRRPGAAPRKIFRRPAGDFSASRSSASGEGRRSVLRVFAHSISVRGHGAQVRPARPGPGSTLAR